MEKQERRAGSSPAKSQQVTVELEEWHTSPRFPRRADKASPSTLSPSTSTSPPPPTFNRQSSQDSEGTGVASTLSSTSDGRSKTTSSGYSGGSGGGKRRLQFKGDMLNLVTRRRTTSSSSTEDGTASPKSPRVPKSPRAPKSPRGPMSPSSISPARSPALTPKGQRAQTTPSKSPKGNRKSADATIPTGKGGYYSVAQKDFSVLERISQRAHKRAMRVRNPHEVFVELEELRSDSAEGMEWEETARWIKFEEDVEEGSGRWGRPHISALTIHSLIDLRRGLEKGCILLDVDGEEFPGIAQEIVSSLAMSGQLPQDSMEPLLHILCKKHKHTIPTTLWERIKNSATNPDGTLHHIGEEIVHRITSMSHTTMHDHGVDDSQKGEEQEGTPSFLQRTLGRSHSNSNNEIIRESVLPLIDEDSPVLLAPRPQKRVVFNIAGSSDSLTYPDGIANSTGGPANSTQSTLVPDTSIDVDVVDENPLPKSALSKTANQVADGGPNEQSHKNGKRLALNTNKSVLSLMEKIPDEAESLTVLVGGVKFLKEPVVAFVRLAQSHLLGELTEVPLPVRFIYLLLGPADEGIDYHEIGRAMATLMSDKRFHEAAYSAVTEVDLLDAIDEFLDDSIVLPPGDWDEGLLIPVMHQRNQIRRRKERKEEEHQSHQLFAVDPLVHTRKPCGGILRDIRKLGKRYFSDFRDALHIQVFLSILFLFISFIAPAIAFGGLMEEVTGNLIGETETLVATGMCGIIYGLFAVQPLSILAFTGPLLLFEEIVFTFSQSYDVAYLQWRACIGVWLMIVILIFAVTESSFLVTYFTRFSEEIFSWIVSIFFIYEASLSLIHVFDRNPLCGIDYPCGSAAKLNNVCVPIQYAINMSNGSNSSMNLDMDFSMADFMMNATDETESLRLPSGFRICNQPNTALFSTILCLGTFIIAVLMRKLRQGKFLGKSGRRLVSDFGMLTAICTMVLVAYMLRDLVVVETLVVPAGWTNSNSTVRGWFINPLDGRLSIWEIFGAMVPAALVGILIFIENQLTVLLINKPEHKLQKEIGYHWDLIIVGVLAGVCGLLGMPWLCAASVRSVQHLQALSVFDNKNAPGENPKLIRVYEQRVTNIAVHFLILLSPFAYQILELIPIPVALGVFYYLAYASINGVQLKKRIKLFFTPTKHHPDVHYVKRVRTLKMHLFTLIQVILVAVLWTLKLSPGAMVYPIAIVFLIPVRKVLATFIFTRTEMEALDSEEDILEDHEEGEGEFEEFEETHVPY